MALCAATEGAGPALVLLHGWGMNAAVWQPLLPLLTQRWRVTTIELPGHGESEALPLQSDLNDWAKACLQAAPSRAVWAGWSLGAQIALQASLLQPQRVMALAMLTGTPCFVKRQEWSCGMEAADLRRFSEQLVTEPAQTLMRFLGLQVRGAAQQREILRLLRKSVPLRPAAATQALHTGLGLLLHSDQRVQLGDLAVPSAWIFGAQDRLVSAATAANVSSLLPAATVRVIAGAGHAPFLSHPQECIEVLEALHD
jgi:pimeloyl-[acyl-carrier protein] methyl ester esterase